LEPDPDPEADEECNAVSIGNEAEFGPAVAALLTKEEAIEPGDIRYCGGFISRKPPFPVLA